MGDAFINDNYGNLIEDKNKGFRGVTYNHLNLPKKIDFGGDKDITYLYNALGQKLQKRVRTTSSTTYTDYQSGFHYENYGLKFFATAEGYVNVSAGRYNYVYNYTDHLGNVRLSYTSDRLLGVRVIEENNYYPFGLKHNGYNNISPPNSVYKYKYNGKELQDELGLNVYDFGARNYMPDLGRWANIDPLAEQSRRWTPYNYAYNNPVYFIDPDGMESDSNSGSGSETEDLGAGDFDAMIEIGYGRKVRGASFAGSGTFSNFDIKMNEKGQQKFENNARVYLKQQGYNPDQDISNEEKKNSYAHNMATSVEPLRLLYNDAGNPTISFNYSIKTYDSFGNHDGYAHGNFHGDTNSIQVAQSAFQTNLSLFYTLAHELMHAWDYNNGVFHQYGFGSNRGLDRAPLEVRAYHLEKWFGKDVNTDKYYNIYKNRVGQNICHEIDYSKFFSTLQKKYR